MKRLLLSICIAVSVFSEAQNTMDNPMTRAVMQAYSKQLQDTPDDSEILIARANEYYNCDMYPQALADLDKALQHVAPGNREQRASAYFLRANVYIQMDEAQKAVDDLNSVLTFAPDNFAAMYLRGNMLYTLRNYRGASEDYRRMLRLKPTSIEALVGLARVAVKENNFGIANEHLDRAVALQPNSADVYVRRSRVRRMMGNTSGAMEDLVLALATDDTNKAVQEIMQYSTEDYPTTMAALTSAVNMAPNAPIYKYMRGAVALKNHHYNTALGDFQDLEKTQRTSGIYESLADCYRGLGQYGSALDAINHAIELDPNETSLYIGKSQIFRAFDRFSEAQDAAIQATVTSPGTVAALKELAMVYAAQKKWKEVADLYAEMTFDHPERPDLLLGRAWALQHINQPEAAKYYLAQVIDNEDLANNDPESLRGFAYLLGGNNADARNWMSAVLANAQPKDIRINYLAACLYSMAGDNDIALKFVEKAIDGGYADYTMWMVDTDGPISVGGLRDDLRFLTLMEKIRQ